MTFRRCATRAYVGIVALALGASASSASPSSAAADTVDVGVLQSLTGTMAISEVTVKNATLLAIDQINAKGGVLGKKIVPIVEDGASDPSMFAQKAQKLIHVITSCSAAPSCEPAPPLTNSPTRWRRCSASESLAVRDDREGDRGDAPGTCEKMKLGIIGAGAVGAAVAMAVCGRGHACQITLVDKNVARAKGVATDLRYGVPVSPLVDVEAGDYEALVGAELVIVTAGINEQAGGATDRSDPLGRLRLLDANVKVFEDVIPRVVAVAPDAPILVVTNPPEPLVDVARALARHERVLSTSTFLDTLRFRVHLGERFGVSPASVNAQVIGEHGTASVFLWSTAGIGGVRVLDAVRDRGIPVDDFRRSVEEDVRFANITIIEGIGASQYGIGIVTARLAEIIVRDERAIVPVGSYQARYGVTLSLPTVVGSSGAVEVLWPALSDDEQRALDATAARLKDVVKHYLPGGEQAVGAG